MNTIHTFLVYVNGKSFIYAREEIAIAEVRACLLEGKRAYYKPVTVEWEVAESDLYLYS
jgi:hypothetical protein